ncbi:MAG: 2-C-methyl-D-erythritol 4-phosphate cytidylyltransferase [Bacteroidales bacterium]|nr:2-C-methyl-D-erythritol 4-phosphate cytidylyltransferase [Bacteroidales bacterium]
MKKYAIITAGGIGLRMESEIPKQFLCIGDLPILMHTINRFYQFDNHIKIILSLPENHLKYWENLCKKYKFTIPVTVVKGGKTRFHSIKNALDIIDEDGFVAVHDGVRPLVNIATIKRTFDKAEKLGNAVASSDVVFSIRKIEGQKNIGVNRTFYKEIQTPQTFNIQAIKQAYNLEYKKEFTDDASVFEAAGHQIYLVNGNRENIKITNSEDIIIAEALLNRIV